MHSRTCAGVRVGEEERVSPGEGEGDWWTGGSERPVRRAGVVGTALSQAGVRQRAELEKGDRGCYHGER